MRRKLFSLLVVGGIASLGVSCNTVSNPALGDRVEQVEREGGVQDVPHTGDAPYVRGAQDYINDGRGRYYRGGYRNPGYSY